MTEQDTGREEARSYLPTEMDLVVIRVGQAEFGIRIESVLEVLHLPQVTRLPFPPPSVRGVVSVRGTLLPVLDLGNRLFGTEGKISESARIVVVRDPGGRGDVALLVDAVPGLAPAGELPMEPPPEVTASLPAGWIEGVVTPAEDRAVTILHLEPVLALHEPADEESR
jgi:purine-binding chemotaxis protein CheW